MAIDGPAGAGKSTVARRLAALLGWRFLDTGAFYRAVTLAARELKVNPADADALGRLAASLELRQDGEGRMIMNGEDVSEKIRSEEVTSEVSEVSAHRSVRLALIGLQRRAAEGVDLVCEGRDMGSVIFPRADVKVYLDADVPTRAKRRAAELVKFGQTVGTSEIELRIIERDKKDGGRDVAPLQRTKDQIYLDTSRLSLDEVIRELMTIVDARKRGGQSAI